MHKKPNVPFTKIKTIHRVFTSLNRLKKNLDADDNEAKAIEESLKQFSNHELEEKAPKYHFPKKKTLLKRSLAKNDHNKSLEELKKILDDDNPNMKKFITAEIFEKKTFFNILKSRKRQFGFSEENLGHQEINFNFPNFSTRNSTSKNVRKRLNAILYNNIYRNSNRSKKNHIEKRIENGRIRMSDVRSNPLSPIPLQLYQDKMEKMKNDKNFLAKEFKNVVEQETLENDLMKFKFSKLLLLKDAFLN